MANVFDVAKYILDSVGGKISTMKLQKLCYYSQAWTLVWDNRPLFGEEFEAWINGPVCRELFNVHKGYFSVNSDIIPDKKLTKKLTTAQTSNIDRVIDFYGDKTGGWLSELTHKEDPWKNVWSLSNTKNVIITKESMKNYYSSLSNGKKE